MAGIDGARQRQIVMVEFDLDSNWLVRRAPSADPTVLGATSLVSDPFERLVFVL